MTRKNNIPLPSEIQIEPTIRCNLNCIMCDYRARRRQARDMSLETFKRIVDQFPELKKVHLHGIGESLLNKNFFAMVNYLKEKGGYVCFNDNMTLVNESVAEDIITLNIDELRVSLDADNAASYEQIRKKDMFNIVLNNIRTLVEAKKRLKSKYPVLKIVIVALKNNLKEIPGIVSLAFKLGINEIVVQNMQSWGRFEVKKNEEPRYSLLFEDLKKIKIFFNKAKERAKSRGIKITLPLFENSKLTCTWPWTSCFITTEGFLTPCCNCPDPNLFNLGNLLENNIKSIWNGDKYAKFREQFKSSKPPKICEKCIILEGKLKDYNTL